MFTQRALKSVASLPERGKSLAGPRQLGQFKCNHVVLTRVVDHWNITPGHAPRRRVLLRSSRVRETVAGRLINVRCSRPDYMFFMVVQKRRDPGDHARPEPWPHNLAATAQNVHKSWHINHDSHIKPDILTCFELLSMLWLAFAPGRHFARVFIENSLHTGLHWTKNNNKDGDRRRMLGDSAKH